MDSKDNKYKLSTISKKEMIKLALDFYRNLYKDESCNTTNYQNRVLNLEDIPPYLISEVKAAERKLKTNKSPGEDGITNGVIKAFDDQKFSI